MIPLNWFLQFKNKPPSHRLCKALNTHGEHSRLRKHSELISGSCSVRLSRQYIQDSRTRKLAQSIEPAGEITLWYWDTGSQSPPLSQTFFFFFQLGPLYYIVLAILELVM